MRYFIDCGGFKATSVKMFMERFRLTSRTYKIHSFEPNPSYSHYFLQYENVTLHQMAVADFDGMCCLYLGSTGEGSTTTLGKAVNSPDYTQPLEVLCLDLSRWLAETVSKQDCVFLKLNVEGAEYVILEKMLSDGTLYLVDELWVDFHWRKLDMPWEDHDALLSRVKLIVPVWQWVGRKGGKRWRL